MRKRSTLAFLVVLSLTAASFTMPGCATMTPEERAQAVATADQQQTNLDAAKAKEEANLAAALAAGDTAAAEKATKNLKSMAKIQIALDAIKENLANPNPNGGFNWESLGGSAVPFLPFPYNLLVGGALAGIAAWQARRAVKATNVSHAIVNAIDAAKAEDPHFAKAVDKAGPTIRVNLAKTTGADEFVESSRVNVEPKAE